MDIDCIGAERWGSRSKSLTTSSAVRSTFPSAPVGHITVLADQKSSSPSYTCAFLFPFLFLVVANPLASVSGTFLELVNNLENEERAAFMRRGEIRSEWDEG